MRSLLLLPAALLLTGCFTSSEPDTPHEAIFREQLAVIGDLVSTLEKVKDRSSAEAALQRARKLEEVMKQLAKRHEELGSHQDFADYKSELRSALLAHTQSVIEWKTQKGFRGLLSRDRDTARLEDQLGKVVDRIMSLAQPWLRRNGNRPPGKAN